MVFEYFRAMALILIAEMGDKTQILAMAFATKYGVTQVLTGVAIGSFFNHALAVALGVYLTHVVPLDSIRLAAGLAFIGFGLWTLRVDESEDDETSAGQLSPVFTVAAAFFVGELGDKTQLTAITLATTARFPLAILLGTVSGMVLTSALGVFIGSRLEKRVSALRLKFVSAGVFMAFGLLTLYENVPQQYLVPTNLVLFFGVLGTATYYLVRRTLEAQHRHSTRFERTAARLYAHIHGLQSQVAQLCLGEEECGQCQAEGCLLRFAKDVLSESATTELPRGTAKDWDRELAAATLLDTVTAIFDDGGEHADSDILNTTRRALEMVCFGHTVLFDGDVHHYISQLASVRPELAAKLRERLLR